MASNLIGSPPMLTFLFEETLLVNANDFWLRSNPVSQTSFVQLPLAFGIVTSGP